MRANMIIEKGATDRRLVHIFIDYKSNRLVLQTGRLFLCLIIILAGMCIRHKQVMPKLTTAIKSTILIGLALLSNGFPYRILCNQRVTVPLLKD